MEVTILRVRNNVKLLNKAHSIIAYDTALPQQRLIVRQRDVRNDVKLPKRLSSASSIIGYEFAPITALAKPD